MHNETRYAPRGEIALTGRVARGSNQGGMRAYNERLVLSLVRENGPMSKAEISRITGLSAQTVSVIMRALEADTLLKKGLRVRGRVGQPSVPMGLNPDGAFFFGLKVGRRSTEIVLVDFEGKVRHHTKEVYSHPMPDSVIRFARETLAAWLGEMSEAKQGRVAGLGIAMPFRLWEWDKSLVQAGSRLDAWRDRDIAAELRQSFDFPVYLCNDASAACGAELVFGDQDKPRDFLYFYIGYFVGGGLVLDNKLYEGRTGNAAALGSMPIVGQQDGVRQQLVDVASLATLETMLESAGHDRQTSWSDPDAWDFSHELLNNWLDGAAKGLAQVIVSANCLIDFQTVLIDGSLPAKVRAELVARAGICLNDFAVPGIEIPEVRTGTIGGDARSLGAASLPLSDRFLVDRNAFLKG
ncbi:ROK family transcriptional regulator [Sulfitobacter sp. F26169L]|uniref:ROK family transcriptional regulator n=1 Tax=Sulfitobacter sp. F26169L TaxID=2996015 RepID=UPI0022609B08|nr:ROK family transcriptional regulator [Sulfitobacter sp. F26169L]MCX7567670.1 ROK family transcriptional regulator [Sulfitobacter sp. F26169L]